MLRFLFLKTTAYLVQITLLFREKENLGILYPSEVSVLIAWCMLFNMFSFFIQYQLIKQHCLIVLSCKWCFIYMEITSQEEIY